MTDENAGAWRGIFFQKNTMGIMMALSSVVFLYDLFSIKRNLLPLLGSIFLVVISAVLVFLSRSASGEAIFLVLTFCSLLAIAWVKWKERLSLKHYLAIGFVFASAGILVLSKLDYLLGLLHRNSSLTGRVPLWSLLIKIGQSNHPIIGGGFGYPWMSSQFRLAIQALSGWGFAPVTAHDGFVDIYLHLGLVGIFLLSALLLTGLYRSIRFIIAEQTLLSTFPLILMIFIIFANISESLFLELDSFVWLLLVFVLFVSQRKVLDPT
jgi:O-antigen ligase